VKWHSPSKGHLTKEADIELPGSQKLEVGFHSSTTAPFQFHLTGNQTKEVGYLKVFFTRRPFPYLDDIAQAPIGEPKGGPTKALTEKTFEQWEAEAWCTTKVIELVQRIQPSRGHHIQIR
jgi:hypothetical protein